MGITPSSTAIASSPIGCCAEHTGSSFERMPNPYRVRRAEPAQSEIGTKLVPTHTRPDVTTRASAGARFSRLCTLSTNARSEIRCCEPLSKLGEMCRLTRPLGPTLHMQSGQQHLRHPSRPRRIRLRARLERRVAQRRRAWAVCKCESLRDIPCESITICH